MGEIYVTKVVNNWLKLTVLEGTQSEIWQIVLVFLVGMQWGRLKQYFDHHVEVEYLLNIYLSIWSKN